MRSQMMEEGNEADFGGAGWGVAAVKQGEGEFHRKGGGHPPSLTLPWTLSWKSKSHQSPRLPQDGWWQTLELGGVGV